MEIETFQRERPTRQRREEESAAALKSAKAHIDRIPLDCNARCLMKGLRSGHDFDLTKATEAIWCDLIFRDRRHTIEVQICYLFADSKNTAKYSGGLVLVKLALPSDQ